MTMTRMGTPIVCWTNGAWILGALAVVASVLVLVMTQASAASVAAAFMAIAALAGLIAARASYDRDLRAIMQVRRAREEMWQHRLEEAARELEACHAWWGRRQVEDEERIRSLEAECVELEAEIAQLIGRGDARVLEQVQESRRALEAARDGFLAFLQEFFFPIGERYETFVEEAEILHRRIARLIDACDRATAAVGVEEGETVIKLKLPSDPLETFLGDGGFDEQAFARARKKLASLFHSDRVSHLRLRWVTELFDAVFKYLEQQREGLYQAQGDK